MIVSVPCKLFLVLSFVALTSSRIEAARETPDEPESNHAAAAAPASSEDRIGQENSAAKQEPAADVKNERNQKRILGIIPNFTAVNDTPKNDHPLRPKQKYNLAFHQATDFSAHFGIAISAAINQAADGVPHYGQGWGPYGQRFGAREADNAVSSFLTTGFLPHVLKEDPRFFRRGAGSFKSRTWYAFTRTIVTRSDSGKSVFNTSNVAGSLITLGISNAYYPEEDRTASRTFRGWGIGIAAAGGFDVLREFYPDIIRKVFHRGRAASQQSSSSD